MAGRKYYNHSSYEATVPSQAKAGKATIIPAAVIRQNMRASHEGGRARCEVCRQTYSANYTVYRSDWRFTGHICRWCEKHGG